MNINGFCYIAKKYQQDFKDLEIVNDNAYGKFRAKGRITWTDKYVDKSGVEVKNYTTKSFVCYSKEDIDILEACKDELFIIEGKLSSYQYTDKQTGDKKRADQVTIFKVKRYIKDGAKVEEKKVEEESEPALDDDIPF